MKMAIGTLLMASVFTPCSLAQTKGKPYTARAESTATGTALMPGPGADGYTVFDAAPDQEKALREQIRLMHPDVLPLRVFFVPHWKYVAAARDFHLHVPTGYGSLMFTHLPSRTVFIDNDRYQGKDWLGYWIAHELGHLAKNSTDEGDAEKGAREFRKRLEDSRKRTRQSNTSAER